MLSRLLFLYTQLWSSSINIMSIHNRIGGVMISILTSNTCMVDQGFEPWLSQTKDYRISIQLSIANLWCLMPLSTIFLLSCRCHMVFWPPEKSTPGSIFRHCILNPFMVNWTPSFLPKEGGLISNPLSMVYWTPYSYPWYTEPPTHVISNPCISLD